MGRLALWLIEGYGRGRLVVESPDERDSFVLDTRNLKALLGGAGCGRTSCGNIAWRSAAGCALNGQAADMLEPIRRRPGSARIRALGSGNIS